MQAKAWQHFQASMGLFARREWGHLQASKVSKYPLERRIKGTVKDGLIKGAEEEEAVQGAETREHHVRAGASLGVRQVDDPAGVGVPLCLVVCFCR